MSKTYSEMTEEELEKEANEIIKDLDADKYLLELEY